MKRKYTAAIIGCGDIAHHHVSGYKLAGIEVSAVVDPLKAASSETRDALKNAQSLLDDHTYAFTVRRSPHGAPIVIE
ncbi:MAG: hypothetical protein CME10_06455, partial [Gemmatimonadetes bacterium]|nr:hypothetical protein [Gemmatimonadota bacterium]